MGSNTDNRTWMEKFGRWLGDFIQFRIMVFPSIVQILYTLGALACFVSGIVLISRGEGLAGGLFQILVMPLILHLIFEFVMVAFSILDTLREIRNELSEFRGQFSAVTISEPDKKNSTPSTKA